MSALSAVATTFRGAASAAASATSTITRSVGMVFSRGRSWGVLLSRTRIDYRHEIGDPATNSIVGAVVGWVARNFPEAPVRIVREGTTEPIYEPSATGPGYMLRLLERPNPYYSGVLQWMATVVDWMCNGNAYWIKVRSGAGRVVALYWVPQGLLEPRWPDDESTFIGWYDYTVNGRVYVVDPRDVVHFRNGLDPNNPRKGRSPLASLFREIFTDEEAANFTASLLRNLGVPGVVIAPSNTVGGGRIQGDPAGIKKTFMDSFGGDKRGEPLVLTAPTDVKVLSFNPQEMQLKELRRIPEERVSAVLGVPAGVAQLGAGLDRNTFSNYGEANVAAYTQGVIPGQRLMAAEIEVQLLPEFVDIEREAVDVWFDWTKASAMQALADAVWKRFESSATKGLLKRSDFLLAIGRTPAADGSDDIYVMPNNYVERKPGTTPPPAPPKPPALPEAPPNGNGRSVGLLLPGTTPLATAPIAEARCPECNKLLGTDVVGATLWCGNCKVAREFAPAA